MAGATIIVGTLAVVVVIGGGLLVQWRGYSYESPRVSPPLASMSLERHDGQATSIDVTLGGADPVAGVNLGLLDGLEPYMKPAVAERRLGPPSGWWTVPRPKAPPPDGLFGSRKSDAPAPYYDRHDGRATLRPFPTPEQGLNWVPVAFPRGCTLEYLFSDERLRTQLAAVLPDQGYASLVFRRPEGTEVLVISLNRQGCADIERSAP